MAVVRSQIGHVKRVGTAALGGDSDLYNEYGALFLAAAADDEAIAKCTPVSLRKAIMDCVRLRLPPNDGTGRMWLIARNGVLGAQVGAAGWVELGMRHPDVATIKARCVYRHEVDEDRFRYTEVPELLEHSPRLGAEYFDDDIVAAYAIAQLTNGATPFFLLDRREILARKARGKGTQPAWQTDFAAMCRKTVLAALMRSRAVPMRLELNDFVSAIDRADPTPEPVPAELVADEGDPE